MRSQNFRRKHKEREQKKRANLTVKYWPSMPLEKTDENGNIYYIEGCKSNIKPWLKRQANKTIRRNKNLSTKGKNYKKAYELMWSWF